MRIEEKALILPALYIIKRDDSVSTTDLIKELTTVFNPVGEDTAILKGRNDTKFSQKSKSKSHRDVWYGKPNNITPSGNTLDTGRGSYLHRNWGSHLLISNKLIPIFICHLAINSVQGKKKKVVVYSEDDMISEGKSSVKETTVKKRSRKLRAAAIDHYKNVDGKLYCVVCRFCFEDRYGDIGKDFIEIHHERPVYQHSDDGFESYIGEAVDKVKPLCSNCHRMIHRYTKKPLSISELKALLK